MADGSPPSKRQKTSVFNLEDDLPDELLCESGPSSVANGLAGPTSVNAAPSIQQMQTKPAIITTTASVNKMPPSSQQNFAAPVQAQNKQLTQLLQSNVTGRNSPGSPGNVGSGNSPHPTRPGPQQPQPSPISATTNSMQSPTSGTNINNIKSPVNSAIPGSIQRAGNNMRTTPSPRVQPSIGTSSASNSPLINASMAQTLGYARNQQPQHINQTIMQSPNSIQDPQQQQILMNGGIRPQIASVMQGGGNVQRVPQINMQMSRPGMVNSGGMSQVYTIDNPNMTSVGPNKSYQQHNGPSMRINSNNSGGTFNMINSQNQQQQHNIMMTPNRINNASIGMGGIVTTQIDPLQRQPNMGYQPRQNVPQFSGAGRVPQIVSMTPNMVSGQQNMSNINIGQMQQNQNSQMVLQQQQQQQQQRSINNQQMQQPGVVSNPVMQPQPGTQPNPNPMVGTSSSGTGGATVDPEKRRLIQHQLFLLLHAHRCQRPTGEPSSCTVSHCKTMKSVLLHMNTCSEGKQCQVAHCASSRQIIAHWKQCKRVECAVCLPLKTNNNNNQNVGAPRTVAQSNMNISGQAMSGPIPNQQSNFYGNTGDNAGGVLPNNNNNPNTQLPGNQLPNNQLPNSQVPNCKESSVIPKPTITLDENKVQEVLGLNSSWNPPSAEGEMLGGGSSILGGSGVGNSLTGNNPNRPGSGADVVNIAQPRVTHEWHGQVKEELRNYLVQKLVQNIFPTPEKFSAIDSRMARLLGFARKVEGSMYEQANSREEYYHLLAEKIYKIKKELEEKKQKKVVNGPNMVPTSQQPTQQFPTHFPNKQTKYPTLMNGVNNENLSDTMQKFSSAQNEIQKLNPGLPIQEAPRPQLSTPNQIPNNNNMNQIYQNRNFSNQPQHGNNNQMINNVDIQHQQQINNQNTRSLLQQHLQGDSVKQQTNQQIPNNAFPQQNSASNMPQSGGKFANKNNAFATTNNSMSSQAQLNQINNSSIGTNLLHSNTTLTTSGSLSSAATATTQDVFIGSPSQKQAFVNRKTSLDNLTDNSGIHVKTEAVDNSKSSFFGTKSPQANSGGKPISAGKNIKMESDPPESDPSLQVTSNTPFVTSIKAEVKSEVKPNVQGKKTPKPTKVFPPHELQQLLIPVVEKLYRQNPEGIPFRTPVDADQLNIPDYFDIVKKPMDLSSIRKKLETGAYTEPWAFVDDIWLMFSNAWLYNRKTSRVYKYCTKLREIFEQDIDPIMQELGYCCGRKLEFSPMTLCCFGKALCTISTGAVYFEYQNRYDFCEKCFNDIQGEVVPLSDEPGQGSNSVPKSCFEKKKNDILDSEPFVQCDECGRKLHTICVLYNPQIWPEGFVCGNCHRAKGTQRKTNRFMARKLPTNKLSEHIEGRVNGYLKRNDTNNEAGYVRIRVVYSGEKVVEVKPGMKSKFVDSKEMPESFPYKAKAFFAFEEVDGVDICFFGVHVQEYGSDAPQPNTRRVYLSYLDSVHFFRPRHLRTAVYHEILIGYFEYCKNLGYEFAHIWACPPSEGDDYVFHCHPVEQKIPKPKRLQEWYKKMLDKAIIDQVIMEYNDIFKQAKDDRLKAARELPYFEGDFWPNVLEESIKELEQEEEDRKQAEANEQAAAEEGPHNAKNGQKQKTKKGNSKKASQRSAKKKIPQVANDLSDKLYQIMEKHKEVFFVIRLQAAETISKLGSISDPDMLMSCELMDGRDSFLTMAREKHYEFSSLRRTKWSTMAMLVELHLQGQDKFVYTCNHCRNSVETRYHCTVCEDFDLCNQCYHQVGHEHKMDQMGLGLDVGSPGSSGSSASDNRQRSVQRCINSLVHACQCRNANCQSPACIKMKKVVAHTRSCKRKGNCPICRQVIALCFCHAKFCPEAKCPVPFCFNLKEKLKQQEQQHRRQQSLLMRRRMAIMASTAASQQNNNPHTPGADHPATPKQEPPSTPMSIMGPATPGSQQGPGTPNTNMMKPNHMASPRMGGKGMPQQSVTPQPQVRSTMMSQMQPGMASPMTMGGHNPMMIQQQQQHPQMVGGNQINNMSPSQQPGNFSNVNIAPPPQAVIAAQQAEKLARAQANSGSRPTLPQQGFPRPQNVGMVQNNIMAGGNMGDQWSNPQQQQQQRNPNYINQANIMNTVVSSNNMQNMPMNQPGHMYNNMMPSGQKSQPDVSSMVKNNPNAVAQFLKQQKQARQNMMAVNPMNQQNPQQQIGQGGMNQQMRINMPHQQNITSQQLQQMQQGGQMNSMQQIQWQQQQQRRLQQQQLQYQHQQPAPPYSQAIASQQQRMMPGSITTNPTTNQMRMQQPIQQRIQRNQNLGPRIPTPSMSGQIIGGQMGLGGQQGMQMQSNVMINPQQNMQQNMMGQQHQILQHNVQIPSRPTSQPMAQGRVPQMSPHMGANRTTAIPGQMGGNPGNQGNMMQNNIGMDQHFNNNQQGNMMGGFPRTMGGQNPGMTFANAQMSAGGAQNMTDSLEKYVTNEE